ARNDCGTSGPVTGSGCSVQCKTGPCVNNVRCQVPASACDNSPILVSGFATNCGDRTAEIIITLTGPGGTIGSHAFNVAAGAEARFDTTTPLNCPPGQPANFNASAIARNDCGTTEPSTGSGCTVQCLSGPCVNNVRCQVPASACSGDQIQISGFATNCGDRTSEIVITLSGPGGTI